MPRPLSQATTSNHPNGFTSTLPLPEGRAGEAWEPPNRMTPSSHRSVSHFSHDFHFRLLFYSTLFPLAVYQIALVLLTCAIIRTLSTFQLAADVQIGLSLTPPQGIKKQLNYLEYVNLIRRCLPIYTASVLFFRWRDNVRVPGPKEKHCLLYTVTWWREQNQFSKRYVLASKGLAITVTCSS
jgi:hypothetical protein